MMLPKTYIIIVSLFLQQCLSSPVYTMQPAYITANIGTSGRNIRHLPCVSRKSGMSGTCMFAIDCLKSNGTHLGTCIDRFYFGSCCHIAASHHDINDNIIDPALIPVRQPPSRVSSTEKPSTNHVPTKNTTTTTKAPVKIGTLASSSPQKPALTSPKVVATTQIPISKKTTSPPKPTTRIVSTTHKILVATNTSENEIRVTTDSYKLSTFQSVNDETAIKFESTIKPFPKPTTIGRPTKPKPRPSSKPITSSTKPIYNRPTTRPTKPTIRPSTRPIPKPVTLTTPDSTSAKPNVTTTANTKPIRTTISQNATRPTTQRTTTTIRTSSPKPTTTKSTLSSTRLTTERIMTTAKVTTLAIPLISEIPIPDSVLEQLRPQTTSPPEIFNEVLLSSTRAPIVEKPNGNTMTNEIETVVKPISENKVDVTTTTVKATTSVPPFVTWGMVNYEQSTKSSANDTEAGTESDWTPLTTPEGWVLLPSVSTTQVGSDTQTTDPSTAQIMTSTTTVAPSSSPSLTTITVDSTTSSTSNATLSFALVQLINTTTSADQETTPSPLTMATSSNITMASVTPKPTNMTDYSDVCGRRMYPEPRIVGGEKSSFGKWPWQISLRQWKTSTYLHKCGAALLNENWAITAAHCVDNVPPSDLLLRLGEHDLSTDSEPYIHQERRVQIVASHPQFDPRTFEYDLALLRFYEPVQFQPNIIPVCVPQNDETFVDRSAFVTGWGRLYEDGPLPSILQEVSVPVINNTVCEAMYRNAGYIEHIPNIFICAGWKQGGFDSCEGDSGGPMVIQRPDKRFLLAGIISWGIGCAEPNQPGVYTRISEFKDWINQILQF